ncbi:hypothetical protein CROQUDRAFT_43929 [Cronartium quercuum f. sp. fusiforme G11]|uniref:Uncharacterized protein n=1 Tax=Cronartium quercuum f. sp. fusiforme G11 TaxID=708437 RepID=A0A9P6NMK6_9BASI|nr:hypothetical protein CROQUDRAFT_43929 [Cronartium quercuum f. sp. fusiforme G11]
MPGASALKSLARLEDNNAQEWKSRLCRYLGACGLGHYIKQKVNVPSDPGHQALDDMYRAQANFAIHSSISLSNNAHISSIEDPREVFVALEKRHGMSSGLATANVITQIINMKPDDADRMEDFIAKMQRLHSTLKDLTSENAKFRMSDELLGLFVLINLPHEDYGSLTQQLLGDVNNISTQVVFARLLTEAQMMKAARQVNTSLVAFAAKQSNQRQ